jgi:excisionase family DNA binding protein
MRRALHDRLQTRDLAYRADDSAGNVHKRPQRCDGLKFPVFLDEGVDMQVRAPLQRNDRRMVFTSSQAARYLGVSLATVRRWTDAGHIGCYRTPGGQRRFSRDQLDDFIASMQQGTDSRPEGEQRGDTRVA